MKNRTETLIEIRNDNLYTLLAREIDLVYHNEILIPRHNLIEDKKLRKQKIDQNHEQIKNIKILIGDLEGIIKIIDGMIKKEAK